MRNGTKEYLLAMLEEDQEKFKKKLAERNKLNGDIECLLQSIRSIEFLLKEKFPEHLKRVSASHTASYDVAPKEDYSSLNIPEAVERVLSMVNRPMTVIEIWEELKAHNKDVKRAGLPTGLKRNDRFEYIGKGRYMLKREK